MNKIKAIKRCSMLQHDSTDCGAACLVSVIRYFGGTSVIEQIRKLSGTTQSGATMLGLYQAANVNGLEATGYEASITDLIDSEGVFILHVNRDEQAGHFIVDFGYERGKFILWDPAKGLILMSEDELEKIWKSRKCLVLTRNRSFKFAKTDKKEKRDWLRKTIKPEKDLLLISIVIGVIISVLGLVMAVFTQKLIDGILPSGNVSLLILASVLVLILLSSRILISAIRQLLLLTQGKRFNVRIVDDFYYSLLCLPKSFFDTRRTGDFVARLNDTMRIQKVISDVVGVYAIDILILVITIAALFYYSLVTAILSVICLPLLYLIVNRWDTRIIAAQQNFMAGYAASESNFINSLAGIQEIKSMNWQEIFVGRNNKIYNEFQDRAFSLGKIKLKLNLITGLTGTIYIMIVLFYSSMEVMESRLTQGELMAILSLSSALLPSVLNLALIGVPLSEAGVALKRMFEFIQIEPEGDEIIEKNDNLEISHLELKNVSFRFPGRGLLLDNINISLRKRKLISLIGESGCGKSTLANIILRFYNAESGEIIVNGGTSSDVVGLKKWRSKIGIIPQEIHIFNGTILQNLLSELTDSKFNEMTSTISYYGLDVFINRFPSGFLTLVGEEGINLSGGEKQILAFIRALIRKPDILIIDEATSFMDRSSESVIMDLLSRLKTEMGILFISHRINLIKSLSDDIYILENGVIKDKGTHSDLMTTDNLYKRFWDDFY